MAEDRRSGQGGPPVDGMEMPDPPVLPLASVQAVELPEDRVHQGRQPGEHYSPADVALAVDAGSKDTKVLIGASLLAVVLVAAIPWLGLAAFPPGDDATSDDSTGAVVTGVAPITPPTDAGTEWPPQSTAGAVGFDSETALVIGVGSDRVVWNLRASAPRDITKDVLAYSSLNESPPAGFVYAGFDLSTELAASDDAPERPSETLEVLIAGGATGLGYPAVSLGYGCGVIAEVFDGNTELLESGSITGVVCVAIPAEDLASPDTSIAISARRDDAQVVFAPGGSRGEPAEVNPPNLAAGARLVALDQPAAIRTERFDRYGESHESTWNVSVSRPRDITAVVLANSEFSKAPPPGYAYAGFDVEMTLAKADAEPLSALGSFLFEIVGAQSATIHSIVTSPAGAGCYDYPNQFPLLGQVLLSGTLSGTMCLVVPLEDLADPRTAVSLRSPVGRTIFSEQGDGSELAVVERSRGMDAIANRGVLGEPSLLEAVDVAGRRSEWELVVSNWRDVTTQARAYGSITWKRDPAVSFVAFHVEMTLLAPTGAQQFPANAFAIGVSGGDSFRIFDGTDPIKSIGCGVVTDQLLPYEPLEVGQVTSGMVCVAIPTDDLGHADTRVVVSSHSGTLLAFEPDR